MVAEPKLKSCHVCLGRGRWRGKKCPICGGSGKLWTPAEASVTEPGPTELDEVVYVASASCDECGPRDTDSTKPHRAEVFRENPTIWCGKCNRGLMTFVLSPEEPR